MSLLAQYADVVFLVGGMVLNVLVLSALLNSKTAIRRRESFLYGSVLGVMGVTYLDMGMALSAFSFLLGAFLWYAVCVFRPAS